MERRDQTPRWRRCNAKCRSVHHVQALYENRNRIACSGANSIKVARRRPKAAACPFRATGHESAPHRWAQLLASRPDFKISRAHERVCRERETAAEWVNKRDKTHTCTHSHALFSHGRLLLFPPHLRLRPRWAPTDIAAWAPFANPTLLFLTKDLLEKVAAIKGFLDRKCACNFSYFSKVNLNLFYCQCQVF